MVRSTIIIETEVCKSNDVYIINPLKNYNLMWWKNHFCGMVKPLTVQ